MRSVFWRSWTMNASRTGATHHAGCHVHFTPQLSIVFIKPRKNGPRHWCVTPLGSMQPCISITSSWARCFDGKQNSEDENFDVSSITAVKASLPLSGIGDSFFWGILRVIAAGIGISLASTGSPLGRLSSYFYTTFCVLNSLLCVV